MAADGIWADLVVADPPWTYRNTGEGAAANAYACLDDWQVAEHLTAASAVAVADCYAVLWCTWPKIWEWMLRGDGIGWTYKTGGSWHKTGALGVGFHWRGDSEPCLVYVHGKPKPQPAVTISNAFDSPRGLHSEKPLDWARDHVRAFCPPGGLVLDLYAGMAPYARACLLEGRRYLGAEIDPDRHSGALALLAQVRR